MPLRRSIEDKIRVKDSIIVEFGELSSTGHTLDRVQDRGEVAALENVLASVNAGTVDMNILRSNIRFRLSYLYECGDTESPYTIGKLKGYNHCMQMVDCILIDGEIRSSTYDMDFDIW